MLMRLDRAISRNEDVDADSPVEPGYDESRVGGSMFTAFGSRQGHTSNGAPPASGVVPISRRHETMPFRASRLPRRKKLILRPWQTEMLA
jgi:hypothetical protein